MPFRHWWEVDWRKEHHHDVFKVDSRSSASPINVWWNGDAGQVGWVVWGFESLWMPASLLQDDSQEKLANALFSASRFSEVELHFNKGLAGAPSEAIEAAKDTAMNPSVCGAFALAIVADGQGPAYPGIPNHEPDNAKNRKAAGTVHRCVNELRAVASNSGAYVSESNFFEHDFEHSYWGTSHLFLYRVVRNWYAAFVMGSVRRWPTPWAFSLLILPLGIYVGFIWTALPFLLSKTGIPVEEIARIGALLQLPPIFMFLWTPVVDVKLRRCTWLILAASVTALCVWVACSLLGASHLKMLTGFLLGGGVVVALVMASCGGLMVTMLSASEQSKASAWNQAGNFGGGVLGAAVVLWLVNRLSLPLVGLATAALVALPAYVALTIAEPPPRSSPWFRGRLSEIRREGLAVLRSPKRRWSVLLLIAPGSTCAAQSLLPALASHYGVGGTGVMWTNGVAGGVALALGSLSGVLVPGDWDRRLTYAGAGLTNALGAIVLLLANRPSVYFWGTLLYLLTAGFCNARYVALVLDVIGTEGHDTSTWYAALTAVGNIPIASMIWLEGKSFHSFGTHGLLWTDAAANLVVFAIVALVFTTCGLGIRGAPTSQIVEPEISRS